MDVGNPAGVGDYQYLQNEAGVDSLRFTRHTAEPPPKPILFRVFLILLAAITVGALSAYFVLSLNRLPPVKVLVNKYQQGDLEALSTPEPSPTPTPVAKAIPVVPKAEPVAPGAGAAATPLALEASPAATGTDSVATTGSTATVEAPKVSATGEALATVTPTPAPTPAEPALATGSTAAAPVVPPVTDGTASAAATPIPETVSSGSAAPVVTGTAPVVSGTEAVVNSGSSAAVSGTAAAEASPTPKPRYEVRIRVSRKIAVTVVKDVEDSQPVFDGKMAPGTPLVLKGDRFWIKTKEPKDRTALKVTTDGKTVTAIPNGVRVP